MATRRSRAIALRNEYGSSSAAAAAYNRKHGTRKSRRELEKAGLIYRDFGIGKWRAR